jgi:hypothetical protein
MRIAETDGDAKKTENSPREVSMSETFCDPVIRRAAWVAVALSAF